MSRWCLACSQPKIISNFLIFLLFCRVFNFWSEKANLRSVCQILPEIWALKFWKKWMELPNKIVETCSFLSNFETPLLLMKLSYSNDFKRIWFLIGEISHPCWTCWKKWFWVVTICNFSKTLKIDQNLSENVTFCALEYKSYLFYHHKKILELQVGVSICIEIKRRGTPSAYNLKFDMTG